MNVKYNTINQFSCLGQETMSTLSYILKVPTYIYILDLI